MGAFVLGMKLHMCVCVCVCVQIIAKSLHGISCAIPFYKGFWSLCQQRTHHL
jgi:hypothetical protein